MTEKKDREEVFISSQAMDFVFRESIGKFAKLDLTILMRGCST